MATKKVIIVEGKTDKERLMSILNEPVEIVCTFGTLGDDKIEEMILPLQEEEVYILVDADDSGNKLRNQLKRELPNARHLYTRKMYKEVARTPIEYLAKLFAEAHFEINESLLMDLGRIGDHTKRKSKKMTPKKKGQ
ncbi:toprim domain-containing protein [Microaerobacter geothermalis]|uniref:toprim domain-containing protein n=1 Tax=Microaerobacter geothermalis TaxID=674972 RepID=UPI001F451EDA|nr:toprim domain-containing protein [Microaerobacter geothermalis]MCF6093090.1 toprim domain-containing protein [Microaerobacter geothermalis]